MKEELPAPKDDFKFSRELIEQQVQKIFLDPFFINSDILRKFLTFIVDETLAGHSDWLKEYTIGINVLNKGVDFKPQDNGIVRIHAGRLRRALHNYYIGMGAFDLIRITIPKGRYVPQFTENGVEGGDELNIGSTLLADVPPAGIAAKQEVIAVLPFEHFNNSSQENSLVDGLGLQLSNALMKFEKFSVLAYYTVRDLWKKTTDLTELASLADIKYVISGCVQIVENKVRLHTQMIDLHNGMQLWSCMFEGEFTSENIFTLQDEMLKFIIAELTRSGKLINDKTKQSALVAVA